MSQPHYCHRCYHDCDCNAYHMLDCEGCTGCQHPNVPAYSGMPSGDMLIDIDPEDEDDGHGWGV